MSREQSEEDPKEVFGPYLIYERLGVGGMATVHRAKKRGIEGFERVAALKRLLPHLAEDEQFVKSFVREAKLASMLQHANVVQLYELGRVGPTYFIAMEYVEGYDLRKVLRQAKNAAGPPPLGVVVSMLNECFDALEYAHTRYDDSTGEPLGIVHRDVSPSNLIVDRGGHLKVIDFGIAKATSSKLRTETGRVKGKLGYMSPEAVQGRTLDARSDIFSAGVIAHELLTARPLFASRNEYETLTKITRGAVRPPSQHNAEVPPELDAFVLRALAKSPDDRWPSAATMREALDRIAMKYKAPATNRTVSEWLSWAFSLQSPAAQGSSRERSVSPWRPPSHPPIPEGVAPLPIAEKDDEIVEIAWGGRDDDAGDGVPVVIEGVPDVSEPHPLVRHRNISHETPATSELSSSFHPPAGAPAPAHTTSQANAASTASSNALAELIFDEDFGREARPPPTDSTKIAAIPPPPDRPKYLATGTTPPPFGTTPARPLSASARQAVPVAVRPQASGRTMTNSSAVPRVIAHNATEAVPALVESERIARSRRRAPKAVAIGATFGLIASVAAFFLLGPPSYESSKAAQVTFMVGPDDAEVHINGAPAELSSQLAAGSYEVAVSKPGYNPWYATVQLRPGDSQTIRVALDRRATPTPNWNSYSIVPSQFVERKRGGLGKISRDDEGSWLAALLCIDGDGRVASINTLLAPASVEADLEARMRKWRYRPYERNGRRAPVCFVERQQLK